MTQRVLLDTGPLVASLNRRDEFHEWARAQMANLAPPLLTCEAVLTETCYLLRDIAGGNGKVLGLVERGVVKVPFHIAPHGATLKRLLAKYSDAPMSQAEP